MCVSWCEKGKTNKTEETKMEEERKRRVVLVCAAQGRLSEEQWHLALLVSAGGGGGGGDGHAKVADAMRCLVFSSLLSARQTCVGVCVYAPAVTG